MERWQNKVAVVTGASSGIGRACCKRLLDEGMIVVGLARRYERMESEFKEALSEDKRTRFHPVKCDVSVEDEVIKAFQWVEQNLGGVDVLINNAGISRRTEIVMDDNTADLKAILDVNVLGPALCTREAFRSMKKRGVAGHVVMVNSILGHTVFSPPIGRYNMYPPSKYAITAMSEILRFEFMMHETKIKITSVSPGRVETEINTKSDHKADVTFLQPEDVADAILFVIQTPPHVQIQELIIKPVGETF